LSIMSMMPSQSFAILGGLKDGFRTPQRLFSIRAATARGRVRKYVFAICMRILSKFRTFGTGNLISGP
jgi:hypothetical protein